MKETNILLFSIILFEALKYFDSMTVAPSALI